MDPKEHQQPRRRRSRVVWISIAVAFIAWAVIAGLQIRSAYANATEARDLLTEFKAETAGTLSRLDMLTNPPDLTKARDAEQLFSGASSGLRSPLMAPLRLVPVVGRQIGVAATLSDSGAALISSVASTYDEMSQILDDLQAAPATDRIGMRARAVQDLSNSLTALTTKLEELDAGTSEGLIGSLWRARTNFLENRQSLVEELERAVATMDGVHEFLAGPNTYVVLAANNSEMRAGSGMYLQVSSMLLENGRFDVDSFEPTAALVLPEPAGTFDPELDPVWDGFYPTSEWRNINLTARFDVSGRVATEMWQALGNGRPQGAVAVDIMAVRRLLEVVGSVEVAGPDGSPVTLDSDNVVHYLLLGQYSQISDDGDFVDRDDRRSSLGDVARAAFEALNGEDVSIEDLLEAFVDMGRGRHLLIWSSEGPQQAAWEALGVAGELEKDDLILSLINRGGNKLDQFMNLSATISQEHSGSSRSVSLGIEITNNTPEGLPPYVAGSSNASGVSPGDYTGYLTLNLPRGAHSVRASGAELVAEANDGPTRLVVIKAVIERMDQLSVDVDFEMDESWTEMRVLPSARIPAVNWQYGEESWTDHAPRKVVFDTVG